MRFERFERFEMFERLKRGFTLLEVMVASLLLAMLVTILTMIFNQSSIAWSTGTASVVGLGNVRSDMSVIGMSSDNALETDGALAGLQVVTLWDPNGNGIRTDTSGRAVDKNGLTYPKMREPYPGGTIQPGSSGGGSSSSAVGGNVPGGNNNGDKSTYIVGVTSWGPDRKTGGDHTWDDITTMPEETD